MNEKHAKKLRRKIRKHPDAQKIPDVNYVQRVMKQRRFKLDGLDKDGKEVYTVMEMRTIKLGNCRRAIYQRVKRALSR